MKITTSIKKVIASLAAITSLSTCAVSIGVSAATETSNASDMMSLYNLASLEDDEPVYFVPYDCYDEYNVAPTNHYIAAMVPGTVSLPSSFSVYLYLNTNSISGSPTNTSNVVISPQYSSYLSLSNITTVGYMPNCTRVMPKFSRIGNPSLPAALFSYYLPGIEANSTISCEEDIHEMTSMDPDNPTSTIYTNKGNVLVKTVYALGDVDRDGDVDSDDATAIQKYCLSLAHPIPGRTAEESAYDEIAFKLAADFNQDGSITLTDAISILMYLAS